MKIRVLLAASLMVLLSGAAWALGLGEIVVNSRLNQPLSAEIVVREAFPGEAEQLVARLASQEDFARVGLERARMPVTPRFETGRNERGQTVIRIRSDEPVREPFLTLLVEASWGGGRLLREYGILLDPPVAAPASTIARTAPAAAPPAPAPAPAPEPEPAATAPLAEAASGP
ncbi:MAG: fimbrial protein FimV, partial [Pseudoxanthomonas sp.]|nr:fimbrial protein FimV [Pseudoxanthomonas sp.]